MYAFYDKLQLRMRTHFFTTQKWGDSVTAHRGFIVIRAE